jgi:hypothetical protein
MACEPARGNFLAVATVANLFSREQSIESLYGSAAAAVVTKCYWGTEASLRRHVVDSRLWEEDEYKQLAAKAWRRKTL